SRKRLARLRGPFRRKESGNGPWLALIRPGEGKRTNLTPPSGKRPPGSRAVAGQPGDGFIPGCCLQPTRRRIRTNPGPNSPSGSVSLVPAFPARGGAKMFGVAELHTSLNRVDPGE